MARALKHPTQEESQGEDHCQAQEKRQGTAEFTLVKAQPIKDTAWDLNPCHLMTDTEETT